MGEVYRAKDTRLDRDVALRLLAAELASEPDRLRRFELEARAASGLNHPAIVAIYDLGKVESQPYISMELIEGRTLEALVGQRLAVEELARLDPKNASYPMEIARLHLTLNQFESAEKVLKELCATSLDPELHAALARWLVRTPDVPAPVAREKSAAPVADNGHGRHGPAALRRDSDHCLVVLPTDAPHRREALESEPVSAMPTGIGAERRLPERRKPL